MLTTRAAPGLLGQRPQPGVGVGADVVEVAAVLVQRTDPWSRNPVTSTEWVATGEPLLNDGPPHDS